ncbi:MAG: DegV family protein [Myxococcota bacterium]
MQILTNQGSNLSQGVIDRYGVYLLPQHLSVDGVQKPSADVMSLSQVVEWVDSAKERPHVLGTSAAETLTGISPALKREGDILVVNSSAKIIPSYDAAVRARETLGQRKPEDAARIFVEDTGTTDVGAGLAVILAGEMHRAGHSTAAIVKEIERYCTLAVSVFHVMDLDYPKKSSSAQHLRVIVGKLLQRRPIVKFIEGVPTPKGTIHRDTPPQEAMLKEVTLPDENMPVWIAVAHGMDPSRADGIVAACRERFDVRYAYVRELSPSIFLTAGPGATILTVYASPILGELPKPPTFSQPWQPTTDGPT